MLLNLRENYTFKRIYLVETVTKHLLLSCLDNIWFRRSMEKDVHIGASGEIFKKYRVTILFGATNFRSSIENSLWLK